jgi:hypothetical protein
MPMPMPSVVSRAFVSSLEIEPMDPPVTVPKRRLFRLDNRLPPRLAPLASDPRCICAS